MPTSRKALLAVFLAGGACGGVAGFALARRHHDTPAMANAQQPVEGAAPAAALSSVPEVHRTPLQAPEPPAAGSGVGAEAPVELPGRWKDLLREIRKRQVEVPDGMSLPSEALWEEFELVWQGMTREVEAAVNERYKIGCRLGKEALAAGRFEEFFDGDHREPPRGAAETRPWMLRQPDEWVTSQTGWDYARGGPTHKVVRIPRGANAELDAASQKIADLRELRQMEVQRFVGIHEQHRQAQGGKPR